jgi:hypothetical protein
MIPFSFFPVSSVSRLLQYPFLKKQTTFSQGPSVMRQSDILLLKSAFSRQRSAVSQLIEKYDFTES